MTTRWAASYGSRQSFRCAVLKLYRALEINTHTQYWHRANLKPVQMEEDQSYMVPYNPLQLTFWLIHSVPMADFGQFSRSVPCRAFCSNFIQTCTSDKLFPAQEGLLQVHQLMKGTLGYCSTYLSNRRPKSSTAPPNYRAAPLREMQPPTKQEISPFLGQAFPSPVAPLVYHD